MLITVPGILKRPGSFFAESRERTAETNDVPNRPDKENKRTTLCTNAMAIRPNKLKCHSVLRIPCSVMIPAIRKTIDAVK